MKKIYLFISLFVFLSVNMNSQDWKVYPYHQQGTYIYFPDDEGVHPDESVEWWYVTGHLTGENTGKYYTFMLSYFNKSYAGFDGFRIFNLSDETDDIFYPQTLPVYYDILAEDSLNIHSDPAGAPPEIWSIKTNNDKSMIPFQYDVTASQTHGAVNLSLDTFKRPLIVGDSGFFYQGGFGSYTYYYSQTGINISGTITFDGYTEPVEGTGWIDRQYGDFNPSLGEKYEWFSIQLDNGTDINVWNIFTADNRIPDTVLYRIASFYLDEQNDTSTSDFQVTRLKYAWTEDSSACYAQQWHFVWNDIDLMITAPDPNRVVELPFPFYEGATSITGKVGDAEVTGVGFAELLHSYEIPEMNFINPDTAEKWTGTGETISWKVLNPDDGNPLNYSLNYSTDGGFSWQEIVSGISDTSFYWDFSNLDDSTVCFFRLTGSSVDGTLASTIFSDTVTLHVVSGIDSPENHQTAWVYPNPSRGIFYLDSENFLNITIMDISGNIILQKNVQHVMPGRMDVIDLSGEKPGIYLLKVSDEITSTTIKLILQKP